MQAACLAGRHLFPRHQPGIFRIQCQARQTSMGSKQLSFSWKYCRETSNILCLAHGTPLKFVLQTTTNDVWDLHGSEMMGSHLCVPKEWSHYGHPILTFQCLTVFQSAIWWQTQLLPSVHICLVTDTVASSHLFLGEIMKHRYLCLKIFWKTDILSAINYKDSYAFANYSQQNWMDSVITSQIKIIYWNARHKLFIN